MSTADFLGSYSKDEEMRDEDADPEASEPEDGVDLMGDGTGDEDSSEEEDDDSDAERAVREGFIVDEDESSSKRRKKKRRKQESGESSRKRRKDSDEEGDLDEDDLDLLEENTGIKIGRKSKKKLKRLRRRRSGSAASDEAPRGINNIFDDDDAAAPVEQYDGDEMAGFIEDDSASDSSGRHGSDSEEDAEERRRAKQKKKKDKSAKVAAKKRTFTSHLAKDMDAETWIEVTEVFGNGQDYAEHYLDEDVKEEKTMKDVFEPSEIASRLLTEADEYIRNIDIPERMQLASTGLPILPPTDEGPAPFIPEDEIDDAVKWMSTRISPAATANFMTKQYDQSQQLQDPVLQDQFLTAIRYAVRLMNIDFLEVPFLVQHRADLFVHYEPSYPLGDSRRQIQLLSPQELWKISALSIKFRAFLHRKSELRALYDQLEVDDDYFESMFADAENVEDIADINAWLNMHYVKKIGELKADEEANEDSMASTRLKRASRESRYGVIKSSVVSQMAKLIGVSAADLASDFTGGAKTTDFQDPEKRPLELAEEFEGGEYKSSEAVLGAAEFMNVHEISHDPVIKKEVRRYFRDYGLVKVYPTELGKSKVDEMHPYYAFKYLRGKETYNFLRSAQYLQILAAQSEGFVTSEIFLAPNAEAKLLDELKKMYRSDGTSSLVEEWNEVRDRIIKDAVQTYLLPAGRLYAQNWLQDEEEDYVGEQCYNKLHQRVNTMPYCRHDNSMQPGEIPSVLAISHGAGDPKRDSMIVVYLDSAGNFREQMKMDKFYADEGENPQRDAFKDLLRRRRPQVIVLGGFSPNTKRLSGDIQVVADEVSRAIVSEGVENDDEDEDEPLSPEQREARAKFEMTFVNDDVARLFMGSKRGATEFPDLKPLGKYCLALARYVQSPLNEYAALGADLAAISYSPLQKLLPTDKLVPYLERALVDIVNMVGVDINRAGRSPYYCSLLTYVAGLGPRKALSVMKKINTSLNGTLTSRQQLILAEITFKNIFQNVAAFLRISQDDIAADLMKRNSDEEEENAGPDVLDDTRVHPEDYDIARKMAADAMEYDEEDIQALSKPSQAVADVMEEDPKKLNDLSLDEFATELTKIMGLPKRLTLYSIREELQGPFHEQRNVFVAPTALELFTMLTGETSATLAQGLIVPVRVLRVRQDHAVLVRLDSGITGTIGAGYRTDHGDPERLPKPAPGQTLQALVIDLRYDQFEVELSTQEQYLQTGDAERRRVQPDYYFDLQAEKDDKMLLQQTQKDHRGRQQRMIKHPNFHNFNAGQAEEFLTHQPRGECVVRPSSKEDHLAVTWKVDEGIFQHIAVFEMNKQNEFSIGSPLRIGKYSYEDLDELIQAHVRQMAKKVEEMLSNDKCKGTQEALDMFLKNYTMANPGSSSYGFGLDKNNPGQFVVSFKTDNRSSIQSWPIKILPGVFSLLGEEHGDVMSLCNAFKQAYSTRSTQGNARLPAGPTPAHPGLSRTPNPYASGRTPAHLAVGGHASPFAAGRSPFVGGRGADPRAGGYTPMAHRPGGQ